MTSVAWAGLFLVLTVIAAIARQIFTAEIRKTDPKLQARIGAAGRGIGGSRFIWWLMSCGYLKLENRRLALLGAVQHLWLLFLISLVVWALLAGYAAYR